MNEQAELLERYLSLLRENPHAEPPPELDADLAAFARRMLQTPPSNGALRARVWQRAIERQTHPNGSTSNTDYFDKETYPIMQNALISKRRNAVVSWSFLVVLVAVSVTAIWFFSRPPKSNVLSPSGLVTIIPALITATSPAETATLSPTSTITASATWTTTPTVTLTPEPTAGPTIEITPATFGSTNGTINGALSSTNPNASYHFVADGDGVVEVSLSTRDLGLISLQSSILHADQNSGGGGGGSGGGGAINPLTIQSISTHMLVLPGDSVTITASANTDQPAYSSNEPITYVLNVQYMQAIDLGANAFDGDTENTLSDFNPVALYKFAANEGDVVTIRATGVDGFDSTLELYDSNMNPPGDISVVFDQNSGPGYDPEIYQLQMPYSGTYYLLVTPGSIGFGSYRLQLTRKVFPSLDSSSQIVRFNAPTEQQLTFTGKKGQNATVNVTLPEDALDYAVQNVEVTVIQDGKIIDIFNHDSALQLTQAGIVLSAHVTLQSDSPVFVRVFAAGKLTKPSSQDFHLEVAVVKAS